MIKNLINELKIDNDFENNIIRHEKISAMKGVFAEIPEFLNDKTKKYLIEKGFDRLYKHQSDAINSIKEKNNVIISTGVASGKSLCYQIPIIESLQQNKLARSLLLFPTKALTQDQMASFAQIFQNIEFDYSINFGTYDGDTNSAQRSKIRRNANLVFTNPDMLHIGILPHHTAWADYFRNLKFIIIDEIHIYRGIFGSHFTNVLRRLLRICKHYGSKPQIIGTSATLSNTKDFCETLLEQSVSIIDKDTSPQGEKNIILYNPPIINKELGIRKNSVLETTRISSLASAFDIQGLVFSQTRRNVELILTYMQKNEIKSVLAYRGGYLPNERRDIEQKLKNSEIKTVVSTNALELGIDVGNLDLVIIHGFPGSISSFRQQAGRAGRSQQESLVIFIATAGLMEQYLIKNPEFLLSSQNEQARINPNNAFILLHHFQCALFEKPFGGNETFGSLSLEETNQYLNYLQNLGVVHQEDDNFYWRSTHYPANEVNLRTVSDGKISIQLGSKIIAEVDTGSAYWMVHPRAVYLHQGEKFLVKELDFSKQISFIEPFDGDYYTQARMNSDFELIEKKDETKANLMNKSRGILKVITQVTGFKKLKWTTHENLGFEDIDLPETTLITGASWISFNEAFVEEMQKSSEWNNYKNNYGSDWKKLKELIRKRDKFSCQHCNIKEDGRAHDVHHKVPFKYFKSHRKANLPDNLVTLCPSCHKMAEKIVHTQSGLAGISHIFSTIIPIFMMCDRNDVRVQVNEKMNFEYNAPGIIVFDSVPGGVGIADSFYEKIDYFILEAIKIIKRCDCEDGCPACVGPTAENGVGAKLISLAILEKLRDRNKSQNH